MNYPKEHIDEITKDFNHEYQAMRPQHGIGDSIASMRNIPPEGSVDSEAERLKAIKKRVRKGSYCYNGNVKDLALGVDAIEIDTTVRLGLNKKLSREEMADVLVDLQSPTSKRKKKLLEVQQPAIEAKEATLKPFKSGFKKLEFRVKCTSINNLIRKYVQTLFLQFDKEKDDKLYLSEFEAWTEKHPMMISEFEKGFAYDIWGHEIDDLSNRAQHKFQSSQAEANCFVQYWTGVTSGKSEKQLSNAQKRDKQVWIELHGKFLMLFKEKSNVTPIRVVHVDGLYLEHKGEEAGLWRIELSHTCPSYNTIVLKFTDKDQYLRVVQKLSYLKKSQWQQMYKLKEKIGTGKFSVVYSAVAARPKISEDFAVKVIEKDVLTEAENDLIQYPIPLTLGTKLRF